MQPRIGSSFDDRVRHAGGIGDIGDERSLDSGGVADLEGFKLPALNH